MDKEKWYVMQVASGMEEKVILLCRQIISENIVERCFYPLGEYMQKSHGIWKKVKKCLFPGYIFVRTSQVKRLFQELKQVPIFTKILGDKTELFPLYEEEVLFLKKICGDKEDVSCSEGYLEGDKVIITNGPLVGMEGQIKKIDRHKRIAILKMELFGGRVTEVKMGLEVVNPLHNSKRQK